MSWTEIDEETVKGERGGADEEEMAMEEYIIEEEEPQQPKKHKRITPLQQERMLQLQGEGWSAQRIANELGLRRTTVHEALKRTNQMVKTNILKFRRMQKKKRRKTAVRKDPLTEEQVELVNQWLEEDSLMSVAALVDRLQKVCGVTVSKSYVAKVIDDFTYSLKRLDIDPNALIKQDNKLVVARQQYAQLFLNLHQNYTAEQFVFVHSAEFTLVARTNPSGDLPNERGRKRSLFNAVAIALNREKVLHYSFQFLAAEPEDIHEFYVKLLDRLKAEEGLEKAVIVLDDTKLAKAVEDVLQLITDSGYEYLCLPKESVFLNPIERLFSSWKMVTSRAKFVDEQTLVKALQDAPTALLTEEDCDSCYLSALALLMPTYHGKLHDPSTKISMIFRPVKK